MAEAGAAREASQWRQHLSGAWEEVNRQRRREKDILGRGNSMLKGRVRRQVVEC